MSNLAALCITENLQTPSSSNKRNTPLAALPQFGYIVPLMLIIFYLYTAAGATLFATINPTLWCDINIFMRALLLIMTFEDWTDYVRNHSSASHQLVFIFLTTFLF